MPTVFTQGVLPSEILASEAPGDRSRTQATATVAGSVGLPAGTVMGKVTASGKYVKRAPGASDGSQTVAGVLLAPLPAVNGDYMVVLVDTDAEVIGVLLNGGAGPATGDVAGLLALGIKVR